MKGLNRNVGAINAALQKRPEVFHAVGMNLAIDIGYRVVDHLMLKLIQALVGFERISEDSGARKNVFTDFALKRLLFAVWNYGRAHLAAAFQDSHHSGLVFAAGAGDFLRALRHVHVAGLATDEGFVRFDLTGQFVEVPVMEREPQPVHHVPSRFLTDAKVASDFVAADAILAVADQPRGGKPLVQAKGGILEDSPGLQGELGALVVAVAFPKPRVRQPYDVIRAAGGAFYDAIRPAQPRHERFAVLKIGEVQYRFL